MKKEIWLGRVFSFDTLALCSVVALFTLVFALLFASPDHIQLLRYGKAGILQGQLWRLFTGHLVHLNFAHGVMNLLAMAVIFLLVGNLLKSLTWLTAFLVISLCVSLALLVFSPGIVWYVGLSGVLHGVLALGLVCGSLQGDRLHLFALLAVFGKLIYEQSSAFDANHLHSVIDGAIVVDAHLYGGIAGVALALIFSLQKRMMSKT